MTTADVCGLVVVIILSIKVYNSAAAGLALDSLVISYGHASAATGGPRSIPPPGVILLLAGPSPSGMSAELYTFIDSCSNDH
jgi:hypothetical protein